MSRNPRPGHRRFELWLPDGHPLWSLPPRTRSAYARALLDFGLAVERRLAAIEEKLDRLMDALAAGRRTEEKAGPSSRIDSGKGEVYKDEPNIAEKQSGNGYVEDFLAALEKTAF
ncbi:MAG: hypothetical protein ACPLQP_11695 [Moorellaceae bacterium]